MRPAPPAGVDPYYLSYKAQQLGHLPRVILAGRSITDSMGAYIADEVHSRLHGKQCEILVMGLTFKEDVPDLRNSKVADVIRRLNWLGHKVTVHDPLADAAEAQHEYGVTLDPGALGRRFDAVIAAVPHREYRDLGIDKVAALVGDGGLLADIKGMWRDQPTPPHVERWGL